MCGIVGYVGEKEAASILVNGLRKLEYRGYDSAGVAIINKNGTMNLAKSKGRLANLEEKLNANPIEGSFGIGHTRWATHGQPSDLNCHPHTNKEKTISVVHNGIIENYLELRELLTSKGYEFYSETDTEVIPNLIDLYYKGNLLEAVVEATSKVEGSYALGVMCSNEPGKVVAVRKDSPLIVGVGKGEFFIASDVPAILNYTRDVIYLNDKEFVEMTKSEINIYSKAGLKLEKEIHHVTWNADAAEKGGHEHFMIKEILEQPKALRDTMTSRVIKGKPISLDKIKLTKEQIENIDKIYIVACGTAYNAGIIGKYAIEKMARIPVEVDIASEFRYRSPIFTDRNLLIVMSQSGETADTLAALREAKSNGVRVLAITNVVGSSVAREADDVLYTWAGPEIAVASTKAYTTQLVTMYMLGLFLAENRATMTSEEIEKIKDSMLILPEKAEEVLKQKEVLQKFAENTYMHKDMFFLGRGVDYAVAIEGSLKVKEISYIHSEAYAGGELKHGTIALIEEGTIVIALATQEDLYEKMISNVREVTTRGAKVLGITVEGNSSIEKSTSAALYIPRVENILLPVITVISLQLLAYYIAAAKGCDIDKPRNLAKSVTVE
jgi:glucosamine--fructose-6-phosphate aminotransferase (isomerizing)